MARVASMASRTARQTGVAPGPVTAPPRPATAIRHPPPHLQRQLGNTAMEGLLSPDGLVAGSADSPMERETDRVADQVLRTHAPTPVPAARSGVSNRTVADGEAVTSAPPIVEEVLATAGRPLDPPMRRFFEPRFGRDLSAVRIHTDERAADSARSVRAHAYTVGSHIVFGAGRYDGADRGRRILAHELTHVVQGAGATQRRLYRLAEGAEGAGGANATKVGNDSAQSDDSLGIIADSIIDVLVGRVVGSGLQQRVFAAAMRGFIAELKRKIATGDLWSSLSELKQPHNAVDFVSGYGLGAAEGIVSPATDLLGLGVLAEQLPAIAVTIGKKAWQQGSALAKEAADLARQIAEFDAMAMKKIIESLKNPTELYRLLEIAGAQAVQHAGAAGRSTARQVVGLFSHKDHGAAPPVESLKAIFTSFTTEEKRGLLSLVVSKAERIQNRYVNTPWAKVGQEVGHAVGALVSNLLMLTFSVGVGNVVTKISAELGRLAPALAGGIERLAAAGKAITALEEAITAAMAAGFKVFKPIEAIALPFLKLLEKLQGFLQRLFGAAGREGAALAAAASATAVDKAGVTAAARATPPPPVATVGPPQGRPPIRGATAEGVGPDFRYAYHAPVEPPPVHTMRKPPPPTEPPSSARTGEPAQPKPVAPPEAQPQPAAVPPEPKPAAPPPEPQPATLPPEPQPATPHEQAKVERPTKVTEPGPEVSADPEAIIKRSAKETARIKTQKELAEIAENRLGLIVDVLPRGHPEREIFQSLLSRARGASRRLKAGTLTPEAADDIVRHINADLARHSQASELFGALLNTDPSLLRSRGDEIRRRLKRDLRVQEDALSNQAERQRVGRRNVGPADPETGLPTRSPIELDVLGGLGVQEAVRAGWRAQPLHFDTGIFSHTYAEALVPGLPRGLHAEVSVTLPNGRLGRADRVHFITDRDGQVIGAHVYEIKPNTPEHVARGQVQADEYAAALRVRIEGELRAAGKPIPAAAPGGGPLYSTHVLTYDQDQMIAVLRAIRSARADAPRMADLEAIARAVFGTPSR